jgi:hypothetical protein
MPLAAQHNSPDRYPPKGAVGLRLGGRVAIALAIGMGMAGVAGAAGWKAPKVDKPPIEWARDGDTYDPPARIIWPPDLDAPNDLQHLIWPRPRPAAQPARSWRPPKVDRN